jgi:hypothetical protein
MRAHELYRSPIDQAALEAWLAEVFEPSPDTPPWPADQSVALRTLIGSMREALVPVEPSPTFVRDLGTALGKAASQRQQTLLQRYRRAVWFGLAAAGSLASIVGVVAYLFRQRDRQHARSL